MFALIQWKLGRLQEEIKNKALQIIDRGNDLEHWEEDPKLKKKRETVLLQLKGQLNSPQPQAKKVPVLCRDIGNYIDLYNCVHFALMREKISWLF
ncbi:hypothetical protein [Sutcliffiella rhizosphaerae]|uniref:hypothetical protein n=1 Tax=Sutcliffiella rhizosphaerae TaxID=2880967 RepID=UPI001E64549F|nr:hypothetical protein [Sutcliffiella rhizosphaerae]